MEQPSVNKNRIETNTLMHYKDEERELSESLHRNLHVMQRFYEPTPEFLLVFEQHMFIKSNVKAFIHVMHFIFNCLDTAEFNKRFLWPILDKTGEARFRKTALDYMNHLNVTHQLGFKTLQLSNIHIPGGLKFIKIIHKFSYLVMKVELGKRGPPPNIQECPDANALLVELDEYVEQGMNFATRLQLQSDELQKRIDEMKAMMESAFDGTIEPNNTDRCWTCLGTEWRDQLDSIVKENVAPQMERVNVFSERTVEMDALLAKLFVDKKENVARYDAARLAAAQNWMKEMYPAVEREIDAVVDGNFINFANLLKVVSFMLPNIMNKLERFQYRDVDAIEFEFNEVDRLDVKALKLQDECDAYDNLLRPFKRRDEERFRLFCQQNCNLPFHLLHTPPVTRRREVGRMRKRLGFINDLINPNKLTKEEKMTSKKHNLSKTSSLLSLNDSKTQHAALQILSKPKSRASATKLLHNVSALGKFNTSNLSSTSALSKFSTPKFSSTMYAPTAESTTNPHTELKFSPSMSSPNGMSTVRKVAPNSALHLNQPIIRSPTGRFQVLDVSRNSSAQTKASKHTADMVANGTNDNVQAVAQFGDMNRNREGMVNDAAEIVETLNARSIETGGHVDDFIGNVSDTLLNDISAN